MEVRPGIVENMGLDLAFWPGRSAFLTGHTGFKGGWLALFLHHLGARISGYALDPPTSPSLFAQAELAKIFDADVRADIRDLETMNRAMAAAKPEIVFHLAAQSLVRESYRSPLETFAVNAMGTAHVLEAARAVPGIKAVVVITSDKCYRNDGAAQFFSENDPLGGDDPYSASKACAEIVTHAYRKSFAAYPEHPLPPTATARAGNVIGGGDWSADRLIPDCIRAFTDGQAVTLRQPDAVRPWQHVLEPVYGYLLLAQRLAQGFVTAAEWNFGPSAESHAPVATVAATMARHFSGKVIHAAGDAAMKEAHILRLNSTRAHEGLGWHPLWPLDTALAETARWYKAAGERTPMLSFSLAQIEGFLRAVAQQPRRSL